jgi:TPR repeat protein
VAAKQASKEKEQQYYFQAARQGHFLGQFYYADTLHDSERNSMADVSEQALLFYTLSAAQGFSRAQFKLADYYNEQYPVSDTTLVFKAIYWMKKDALQGNEIAQIRLPFLLLDAKAWLLENQVDIAGYSAVPEACFWFDLAEDKFQGQGVERPYPLFLLECGCCGKSQEALVAPAALKRCAKCKGVRYCGRDCQAMHWTMGHKVECKAVVSYRKTLVAPSMYTYPYPVHVSQEEMLAKINTSN